MSRDAGKITRLQLCVCEGEVSTGAALDAVKANTGALRRLDLRSTPFFSALVEYDWEYLFKEDVDEVLDAAQGLLSFDVDVRVGFGDARTLLARQGRYSVVRIRRLIVDECSDEEATQIAADIRLHPSLQELCIWDSPIDTPAALDALVDVVIACGLSGLNFFNSGLGPQLATHLTRLLRGAPRLSTLLITSDDVLDETSTPILAAALRASLLTALELYAAGLWENEDEGNMVVDGLVGHPTLEGISLASNRILFDDPHNTVGACLARLVAANIPSLHTLSLESCEAGDNTLHPVFAALISNTSLRTLCLQYNDLSAPFAREVVLPSIRANSELRKLIVTKYKEDIRELVEAEALVAARQ